MNITITTGSGIHVNAPMEKWLTALIVTLSDSDQVRFAEVLAKVAASSTFPTYSVQKLIMMTADKPEVFEKLISLVDNKVEGYASIPESVQASLNSRF